MLSESLKFIMVFLFSPFLVAGFLLNIAYGMLLTGAYLAGKWFKPEQTMEEFAVKRDAGPR